MYNNMLSCNNSATENGKITSSKTPSFSRSKLSSHSTSKLTPQRYEESASNLFNLNGALFDSFDLNEVLGDESAKKLLQTCNTSWLCSHNLLRGNFVMIPALLKLCIFQVVRANKVPTTSSIPNGTTKGNHNLLPRDPNLVDHLDHAFVVDRDTEVHLYSPLNSSVEVESAPRRGLPRLELEHKDIGANVGDYFPKLGVCSSKGDYFVISEEHFVELLFFLIVDGTVSASVYVLQREFFMALLALERLIWLDCVPMMLVSASSL